MNQKTLAVAFDLGRGRKLNDNLWYYEGVTYEICKGAVKFQKAKKTKFASVVETLTNAARNTVVTIQAFDGPPARNRAEWVQRFAQAARIQGRYNQVSLTV